ncbi:macrophage activating glycoprotein [Coprinopsis sp. MPI-PUGE-AT-0042]|nr:macrophage activating glycoprotein [Coprinopsis sp. MPI-PUGE-AT-0042]
MVFSKTLATTLASLAVLTAVQAQVPEFQGELMLRPSINDNKCLTAASNTDGAWVTLQTCTGAASQKWVFAAGTVRVFGNKCLDVSDGLNVDGTKLQIWGCGPDNNWDNVLEWEGRGKCIDVSDGSDADGNRNGQYGTNQCGTGSSQTSNCQTAFLRNRLLLWGPPYPGEVGGTERVAVAWCTKSGRGTRTIPDGTLQGVHFVKTPEYVQITGVGDFTKMNIPAGDYGGEMDNKGADGKGNPSNVSLTSALIGGLLFGNSFVSGMQFNEWTEFISDREFCIRACVGPRAKQLCNHIYDVMGCYWNMPANYDSGVFEECDGTPATPMGVYGTSTWYQGVSPTPAPHPAPASSNCRPLPTVSSGPL